MPRMLNKILAPHSDRAYAILRIVAGLLFAVHGMQKVLGVLTDLFQSQRAGMSTVLILFIIGGLLLLKVDEQEGIKRAKAPIN